MRGIFIKALAFIMMLGLVAVPVQVQASEAWREAYIYLLQNYNVRKQNWIEPRFTLFDINKDGIPELVVTAFGDPNCPDGGIRGYSAIYTFTGNEAVLLYIQNLSSDNPIPDIIVPPNNAEGIIFASRDNDGGIGYYLRIMEGNRLTLPTFGREAFNTFQRGNAYLTESEFRNIFGCLSETIYLNLINEHSAFVVYRWQTGDEREPISPYHVPGIRLQIGNIYYEVQGRTQPPMEAAPFIHQGRTMVPLRVVAESLGANVTWDAATRSVNIRQGAASFVLVLNRPLPGGMGTAVSVGGRTFVPVTFVAEQLGANVRWDANAQAVYITAN